MEFTITVLIAPISSYRFMTANTFFPLMDELSAHFMERCYGPLQPSTMYQGIIRSPARLKEKHWTLSCIFVQGTGYSYNFLNIIPKIRYLNPCLHALNISDLIARLLGTYGLFATIEMKLPSPTFVRIYGQHVWVHDWGFRDLFGWCHSGIG